MFVCRIIIDHQMQFFSRRNLCVDLHQEFQPFLMTVPLDAASDHRSVQQVHRGEQRCRAVAFVVVRHCSAAARIHWQALLRAVQRLNLAFFIDAQHHCIFGRIHIKPHNIHNLFSEPGIGADFERAVQMRLQLSRIPGPPDARMRNTQMFAQRARAPVCRTGRARCRRRRNDPPRKRRGLFKLRAADAGPVAFYQPVEKARTAPARLFFKPSSLSAPYRSIGDMLVADASKA
jgi:hypothetical protein